MICVFFLFVLVQKSFLTKKNVFLFAEINFTTRGPLYTCLVIFKNLILRYLWGIIAPDEKILFKQARKSSGNLCYEGDHSDQHDTTDS